VAFVAVGARGAFTKSGLRVGFEEMGGVYVELSESLDEFRDQAYAVYRNDPVLHTRQADQDQNVPRS
jgi:hypothetical protein